MQLTEKFRDNILFAFPELTRKDAEQVAELEGCSTMTVYRHFRLLKDFKKGQELPISTIMVSLGELAISRKKLVAIKHKRASKIMKQLSAA